MQEFEFPQYFTRLEVINFVQRCDNLISIYSGIKQTQQLVGLELDILDLDLKVAALNSNPESVISDQKRAQLLNTQNRLTERLDERARLESKESQLCYDLCTQVLDVCKQLVSKLPDASIDYFEQHSDDYLYGVFVSKLPQTLGSAIENKAESRVYKKDIFVFEDKSELDTIPEVNQSVLNVIAKSNPEIHLLVNPIEVLKKCTMLPTL